MRARLFIWALLLAGVLCVAQQSRAQLTMTGSGGGFGGAAAATSAWGDKGTMMTLSSGNTIATASGAGFTSARGTQGYSAGKRYLEWKIIATGGFLFGMADATTATGAAMDLYTGGYNNSYGFYSVSGTVIAQISGSQLTCTAGTSTYSGAVNDVFALAYDGDNGFSYIAKANSWFFSGDPTSGPTGTGNICVHSGGLTWYPSVAMGNGNTGSVQIITSGFTYSPPSGYSAWNFLLKRDVLPDAANDNSPMWLAEAA